MPNRLRAPAGALPVALIVVAPAAAAAHPAAPAAHAARGCTHTHAMPSAGNVAAIRTATLCLINVQRRHAGLRPLRDDHRLRRAAQGHSRDMVARRYFDHTSPSGVDGGRRIAAAHYRFAAWGENIAWGSGRLATPAQTVRAWMSSPGHRANILNGRYRQSGIGVAIGTPAGIAGATYTNDFGSTR